MLVSAVLLTMIGIAIIAQIVLMLIAPYGEPFRFSLLPIGSANYGIWQADDDPGLPPLIDTGPVQAAPSRIEPNPVIQGIAVVRNPDNNAIFLPWIITGNVGSGALVPQQPSPTNTPTPTSTSGLAQISTSTPTADSAPATSTPQPTRTSRPTSTSRPPQPTETSAPPATNTPIPGIPPSENTSTPEPEGPTDEPEETETPVPTSTRRPTRTPGPTETPVPPTTTPTRSDPLPIFSPEPGEDTPTPTPEDGDEATPTPTHTPTQTPSPTHTPTPEPGTVFFSASEYGGSEAAGRVPITVQLAAPAQQTIRVNYATNASRESTSATPDEDYTPASGTLTFSPGQIEQSFEVVILDDTLREPDETVLLTLSSPQNASLGTPSTATLIITDDEQLTAQLSANTYSILEDAGIRIVTVQLSTTSTEEVQVSYAVGAGQSGTPATPGDDFTAVSDVLTFAPGDTQESFSIPIIDDTLDEPDETVRITLSDPVGAELGTRDTATLTILDDDEPAVEFRAGNYSVNEDAGTRAIEVGLTNASTREIRVEYATSDATSGNSASVDEDYTATSGTLVFAPGETRASFAVPIIDDTLGEPDETVLLTLSDPFGAELGARDTATLTIRANDTPQIRFAAASYSTNESAGTRSVTVRLSNRSTLPVEVGYAATNGSATEGDDYTLPNNRTLTIPPGQTQRSFQVSIINDDLFENSETIVLSLESPQNAMLGTPDSTTITIAANDSAAQPSVFFEPASYIWGETEPPLNVRVQLSRASGVPVTVSYAPAGGSATEGDDYTLPADRTLTIPPGQTEGFIRVTAINDALYEGEETVFLALSDPQNATLGTPSNVTITLIASDNAARPVASFVSASATWAEDEPPLNIRVRLNRVSGAPVTLRYAPAGGTATEGDDYTLPADRTLTIPAGQTEGTIRVTAVDDNVIEDTESLTLALSDPQNATLGTPASITIQILDDDQPAVQFAQADYTVDEDVSSGSATITVELTEAFGEVVRVDYATNSGSNGTAATPGADYTATSGTLTFLANETQASFTVAILDDTTYEGDETVNLTLSNPQGATLGTPSTARLTIQDESDRPTVEFVQATYTGKNEGDTVSVEVKLSAASEQPARVDFEVDTAASSADASDYTLPANLTVTFAPGETEKPFDVTITDDTLFENDENIVLRLIDPENAVIGGQDTTTIEITENDAAAKPEVYFNPANVITGEGNPPSNARVELSTVSGAPVTVDYALVAGGSATEGDDFTLPAPADRTLTIPAGQTEGFIPLTIVDDALFENDEIFTLELSAPQNATLGTPDTATITIKDNDASAQPSVFFDPASYTWDEEDGTGDITVRLSTASGAPVTVDYATGVGGTATEGNDYDLPNPAELTIPAGQTAGTIPVTLNNDGVYEGDENFTLELSAPQNATLGASPTADITIQDDTDVPTVQFVSSSEDIEEPAAGSDSVSVGVTLSNASTEEIAVKLFTDGDASNDGNDDYDLVPANTTLTFPANTTGPQFIEVKVKADDLYEGDELLILTLENQPDPGDNSIVSGQVTIGTPDATTITISDVNDIPTVSFMPANYIPGEGGPPINVNVELQGKTDVDIQVSYSVTGGTATENADYTLPDVRTLTFPADPNNMTQFQSFQVTMIDDVEVEDTGVAPPAPFSGDAETVFIELDPPPPDPDFSLGTPSSATVYILDNDGGRKASDPLPAQEVDESYENRYFQTGGPRSEGEWYVVEANEAHEFEITIPSDWPAGTPVSVDLFSPGLYESLASGLVDEVKIDYDTNATYTLTRQSDGAVLGTTTYNPDETITNEITNIDAWGRLYTIANPTPGATYILNAKVTFADPTSGRDTNGWGLYVGYDDDGDITTPPIDEGTSGNPIKVGIVRGTYQYTLPDNDPRCMELYQDVDSSDFVPRNGVDTIAFHNFDIEEPDSEVWYYSPDDTTVYRGTKKDGNWNGPDGTSAVRGEGDVIYNPAEGQWRLVTCTDEGDQFIQEGITGKPTYFTDDGRLPQP